MSSYDSTPESTPSKQQKLEDVPSNQDPSLQRKLEFQFWETKTNVQPDKYMTSFWGHASEKTLKISELKIGSHGRTTFTFRVSYISEIMGKNKESIRVHGIDKSGEIEIICFGSTAERVEKLLKVNGVYSMKTFYVRKEKAEYPTGFPHGLQVVAEEDSTINEIDESEELPPIPFSFIPINELNSSGDTDYVDLLAAVIAVWDLEELKIKGSGETILKRDITITDKSKGVALLTLWGKTAESFSKENLYKVLALRRATLSWIKGTAKLTTSYRPAKTLVWLDPSIPEAISFAEWFSKANPKQQSND